jgi:hypothetical protein
MARPIKQLHAEPDVAKELRRRARSTAIGARDKERANIILLRRRQRPSAFPFGLGVLRLWAS